MMFSTPHRAMRTVAMSMAALALLGTAGPIAAQKPPAASTTGQGASVGDGPGTRNLNREEAAAAARQYQENLARQAEYDAAAREHAAAVAAAAAARQQYEEQLAAANRAQADYDAAYARWQADVAACRAGNVSRCGAPAPTPR